MFPDLGNLKEGLKNKIKFNVIGACRRYNSVKKDKPACI
jgi:hypothetical protein